jgi:hypothetical protein
VFGIEAAVLPADFGLFTASAATVFAERIASKVIDEIRIFEVLFILGAAPVEVIPLSVKLRFEGRYKEFPPDLGLNRG